MKVLIVNTKDQGGGAAIAAYRLHRSLIDHGVDSKMLVQTKSSDDYTVICPNEKFQKLLSKFRAIIDLLPVFFYKKRKQTIFSTSWFGFNNLVKKINEINPDIVHLHWVCHGMLTPSDIAKITKPILWTLHDNWPFTGGCHIMWDCTKYLESCGNCPNLNSSSRFDLSRILWKRKKRYFDKISNLTINGVSTWITDCSKKSSLFKNKNHLQIPNLLDTNKFKPMNSAYSRELWNLPTDKKLILFGANSATSDENKGFKLLLDALVKLEEKDIELVVFGSTKPEVPFQNKYKVHYLGHLNDYASLATLYSCADVMIVPSLQESFGQTAMEAMSCGLPVVAFATTGLLDIIDHKDNGYLVKPFSTSDLTDGIRWIINSPNYKEISLKARSKVQNYFDKKIITPKYIEAYESLMKQ